MALEIFKPNLMSGATLGILGLSENQDLSLDVMTFLGRFAENALAGGDLSIVSIFPNLDTEVSNHGTVEVIYPSKLV